MPAGSIYGFLGRNGMGKTTTIRILLGLEEPTRGGTRVFGEDSRRLRPETRARIGYLPEGHHVYGWMTVRECGQFQAAFFPKWNQHIFDVVITHFRLTPKMKAGHLSRGQRAGLCLAMTLAPEPELLVLDDPALGLDPVARRSLLQSMLYVTRQPNRTILFSSHLLSDVERVADRIVRARRRRAARRLHGGALPRAAAPLRAEVPRHAAAHAGGARPAGKLPHRPRNRAHRGQRHAGHRGAPGRAAARVD